MDMLATTHVNRRGIYLWSNTAIYGNSTHVRPSELHIDARLPALASGGPPPGVNAALLPFGHTCTRRLPMQQRLAQTILI